jgi:hypothetical protein
MISLEAPIGKWQAAIRESLIAACAILKVSSFEDGF